MNHNKKENNSYWIKEARRYLVLALIGATGKVRENVEKALECLEKIK